jgi:hypothetical protein
MIFITSYVIHKQQLKLQLRVLLDFFDEIYRLVHRNITFFHTQK